MKAHRAARIKGVAKLLAKVAVSIGLIALIVHKTETKGIFDRLLDVNIAAIFAAGAFVAALATLPAQRWRLILRLSGRAFGFSALYRLWMIGNFLSQAIPTIGADGVRAWYVSRHGLSLARAISSVILDRLAALGALLLLSLVTLPWLWAIVPPLVLWWLLVLILLAAVGTAAVLHGFGWLPASWTRWRIVSLAHDLSSTCRDLARSPRALLQVIVLSLIVHLALAVLVYALAVAAHVTVGLVECLLLFPLVILVATIPIGVAGWGMREGAMVLAFGFLDIPAADALLVSILFGTVVAISSIPGLIFWLVLGRELKEEIRSHDR